MMHMEQETIYGSNEDTHTVMSEKVQSLAGSIYQEFEKMIVKYDEEVVKDLMPLVVNVLECLDLAYTQNQEHEVELELLREDNEQLVTQYEREKQLRKSTDQKLLEVEDSLEDERKDLFEKIESLESIVRMLELKAKNSSDHVYRLEEKEQEMKKEFSKLHERYTELLKTHMDCMERTKILMGSGDRIDLPGRPKMPAMSITQMSRSSGPISFGFTSLESGAMIKSMSAINDIAVPTSPTGQVNTSLQSELIAEDDKDELHEEEIDLSVKEESERGWSETLGSVSKDSSPDQDLPEDLPSQSTMPLTPAGKSHTKREQRCGNTLYQELSFQDAEALGEMDDGVDITGSWVHPGDYASSVNDNFFGMGKEVENLIMENNELLATKNALNVVKDDLIAKVDELTSEQEILRDEIKSLHGLKNKFIQRITEIEDELKRTKEESDKLTKASKSDDEDDVPMAQRKRFTRVEMARVLMERNQYKERFMELQEAVRWSEMIRATKNDPNLDKKKQSVWKFFSSLFSSGNDTKSATIPSSNNTNRDSTTGYIHYNVPTHHVSPALESVRLRNLNERKRGFDYIDEFSNEKLASRRANEKKEQLKQVRAHVSKDDGRLRAYGWSLPGKSQSPPVHIFNNAQVPVPVPVYCRPLMEHEPGMKLWCATGVNLSGGRTRDGGSVVGASVFYSGSHCPDDDGEKNNDNENSMYANPDIEKISEELKEGEKIISENEDSCMQQLSSLVWICTSSGSVSKVTIVDANNPADILHAFTVCQDNLLCVASVPGAKESDYLTTDEGENAQNIKIDVKITEGSNSKIENIKPTDDSNKLTGLNDAIGKITFVSCATGSNSPPPNRPDTNNEQTEQLDSLPEIGVVNEVAVHPSPPVAQHITQDDATVIPTRRLVKQIQEGIVKDGLTEPSTEIGVANEELERATSILPTVWLGSQNGCIFVHSAVSGWRKCLHTVKLQSSVLNIVHIHGRVVCALADGTVVVFKRGDDGQWDLTNYYSINLSLSQSSVRCLAVVHSKVWCGCKNRIHVLDPVTLTVQTSIDAHPRKESQVRQMAWLGDGVWVSIRLDSTLRLYHAHTYQHLQDVDIEPYVSKMLGTGKLGFSFVRITALLISLHRLWIGTGNGVIISVPLTECAGGGAGNAMGKIPGGVVRIFSDTATSKVTPGSFIPYCSMAQAQLSFHGHRDSVKFFVAVPGNGGISAASAITGGDNSHNMENSSSEPVPSVLVISGGEGYIDFRSVDNDKNIETGEECEQNEDIEKSENCYLIVWQMGQSSPTCLL